MQDLQSQLPSGGFSNGGERQYMWKPKQSKKKEIVEKLLQNCTTAKLTSIATVTEKKSFIVLRCSANATTLAFDALPTIFLDRDDHVFCEL